MSVVITVGENSYCTLTEADTYHATRFGNSSWSELSADAKSNALIGAFNLLETIIWHGYKSISNQATEFPRVIRGVSETPKNIKFGQSELAFQLSKGYLANSAVTKLKVGSLSINTENKGQFPLEVQNLIQIYMNNQPKLVRT